MFRAQALSELAAEEQALRQRGAGPKILAEIEATEFTQHHG